MTAAGRQGARMMALAVLAVVLPLVSCTAERAVEPAADAPATLSSLVVRRGELAPRLLLTGELRAVNAREIRVPRTPSWVLPIRWMVDDGAVVSEGDRVLELDNAQFVSDLDQKRLAEAKAEHERAKKEADVAVQLADTEFAVEEARVRLAKARLDAAVPAELRPLREHQEKQLALERARTAYDKAVEDLRSYRESSQAELEVLRIELRKARREIRIAEQAIEALTLRAPADGIVVVAENPQEGRKFQVGDNAWVGLQVMQMPDLAEMKVEAHLSDVDDGRVAVGMRAECTLDAWPELRFPGRVVEISPIALEQGRRSLRRAFRLTVLLERSDPERMRPGMSVKVDIRPPASESMLLAPRAGLDLRADPPRARLLDGGTVEVRLGSCTPAECVVEDGLAEGTRLRAAG